MPPAVPSGAAHAASPVSLPEPPCQRPPAPSVDERQTCARHPELCPRRTRTPVESPRTTPRSLFSFAPAPSVHRPDAWRVADFFIAGGPFEIIEVSHSRVSKTPTVLNGIAPNQLDFASCNTHNCIHRYKRLTERAGRNDMVITADIDGLSPAGAARRL